VLAELRDTGASRASRRAWLGIDCTARAGELQVLRVGPGSPAEAAGMRPGDRIARIDGEAVEALEPFYRVLWRGRPAERDVTLEVRRGEAVLTLTLHAVDRATALRQARGV
jgi:C-terminal processing protease CtpA/Prc